MADFSFETIPENRVLRIKMNGDIDEDAVLDFGDLSGYDEVVFDLGGVRMVNSCGIRSWVKWTAELPPKKYKLINCTKPLVDAATIIKGFIPTNFEVVSILVPFFCDSCEKPTNLLMNQKDSRQVGEFIKCPHCGAQAEIDIFPESYFTIFPQKN